MLNKNKSSCLVPDSPFHNSIIKNELVSILQQEALAIQTLSQQLPTEAITLTQLVLETKGRVVLSGMGKSGAIAKKLVATFSSTGTPALFIHPSEALHGDLGMVQKDDLFIALSKSGSGSELENIIPILKSNTNQTALICCNNGRLSHLVNLTITLPFDKEACPLNLAPTSSSTMMLAFGDAIAISASTMRGFTSNDFAKFHPHGALGKRLNLKVKSLMVSEEKLPLIKPETSFSELIVSITSKRLGIGIVVDQQKQLLGIITDGDLRRACKTFGPDVFQKIAADIMTAKPQTASPEILAQKALELMELFNITSLVVTEKHETVVGIIHIHDIIKAGLQG
jgi:arabinose-5-phosphate isomerase